ncbi:MAG: HAD-IIA family hydrolase [Verrucomicrobiota bacterium]|nr:HAD-IIA family hydrolase [Verrucomicrobiota bacterium]
MSSIRAVILDLDGTIYNGRDEVPGAARFVRRLIERDIRYIFVTNRANRRPASIARQLRGFGIPCRPENVLTSAEATALSLKRGKAFVIGEHGLRSALRARGFVLTDDRPDYVIVSFDTGLTYARLAKACDLINCGAAFVATNPDKRLKTKTGFSPGAGAIAAALATATGVAPLVIGKPEKLLIELGLKRMKVKAARALLVGDNVETDAPAGRRAGVRTALILSGVSSRSDVRRSGCRPTWVVADYDELWEIVERARHRRAP